MTQKAGWALTLVIVLSLLPYLSAVGMGFIYDDHPQIESNPYLRVWPGYARVFSSDVWSLTDVDSNSNYYRPLMWVAYNAIYSIAGASPWAFHLVNLLLHACVTAVVFFLTMELWKDLRIATIAGALFALHPVHSEPVVWIAAIPDLAYTLFFLLALYFYIFNYKPEAHAVIASVACFAVALLWKESAVMFLPCAIAYDALALRQFRFRRWASLIAVICAYLTVRTLVLGGLAPAVIHEGMSPTTQALTAISHLSIYVEKLLVPVNLTFFYSLQAASRIDARIVAVVLVFALAAWKLRGKMLWSALLIPMALLPALAITHVVVPLAERNLYLASVGFVWLSSHVLVYLGTRRAFMLTAALSVAYFAVDWFRVPVWRDEITLFGQALRLDPQNSSIRLRLSNELAHRGRYDEALFQLDEILKHNPKHLNALTSKAGLFVFQKDWQSLDAACTRAFEIDPNSALCHLDTGISELQRGSKEKAWTHFDLAYQSNPRLWQAVFEQGMMALDAGNLSVAIQKLEQVVAASPTAQVFTILGTAHARMGNSAGATAAFEQALRIDPKFLPARQALSQVVQK